MRKSLAVLLMLLALLIPMLAACGGGGGEADPEPTEAAGETTEEPTEATEAEAEEPTEAMEEPTEAMEGEAESTEEADAAEEPTEAMDEAESTEEADTAEEGATGAGAVEDPSSVKVGLVTDVGRVNDGTFNQFAHEGVEQAVEEFGFEYRFIETQAQTDYDANLDTLINDDFDVIVTVGFLIEDATFAAAEANPDIVFIGVDQFYDEDRSIPNLVGLQFREDQAGFLAGALAGMMSETNTVGVIGGVEIPPVKKFRNAFDNGAQFVSPDINLLGVYIPSFTDPAQGASTAEQFIGEGADVIFGAGGPTGSGGIRAAAEQDVYVIGVDQDEYVTTFGSGESPGADRILTSAIKRVDVAVNDQIGAFIDGTFEGNGIAIYEAANDGVGYADFNETADEVPDAVKTRLDEILAQLADGSLTTGVDPVSGDLDEATIPEPQPFEGAE